MHPLARYFAGLLLAFLIGFGCGLTNFPVPAPPAISGALLVMSITVGFVVMDKWLARRERQ